MGKQKLIGVSNNIVTVKNEIQTDIFNGGTSEFFINMNPKDIPPKEHEDRGDFVRREKLKCKQGININGVPITGRLYYHLNFHKIALDTKVGKDIERVIGNPLLRDNEWMIFNAYEECLKGEVEHDYKKQAFMIGGGRQISKSDSMCSMSLYALNLFDNPEAVLLFTNSADKQTYTKKAQLALTHGESFIMRPTIDNNWTKTEIRFGLTNKDNTTNVIGRLYMYNTAGDNAPQIASGKSISFFAYDEALKHGSSIYYEDRIGKIEDVKVGDRIYGQDGKLTTVEEVLPQGITEIYKMTLRDGRIVETSPNHLWDVLDIGTKTHKTLTTEQIFKTNNGSQIDKRYNKIVKKQRYFIPKNGVVEYPEKEVFVEPYYLGLWLGDGASTAVGSIANIDEPILEYLKEYANRLGGEFHSYTYKNHTIRFKNVKRLGDRKTSLRKLFDIYNLYDNKHIPNEYLFNSYDIRMELLKGLGDSDGTVYKDGHIEFSNTNFVLIQQVAQLIRSLGINCSLSTPKKAGYKKDGVFVRCKDSYKISIRTTIPIFKLERKLNNYNISTNLKKKSFEDYTSIVKVEKAEDAYSTCIRVDNENSLFLTNDFIVTHNCAKDSYRRSYEAVLPALVTPYGWRCAPILAFTGGDVQKSQDAEDMFMNPEGANVKAFSNEGKKTGFFMGGWYRQDFKYPMVFTEYLNRNGYIVPKGSELDDMKILVTDFDKANQTLDEEIVAAGKSKDPTALLEKKMFFPRTIKEMFLKNLTSNFKSEYINQQREYIKSGAVDVTAVELYRDLRNGEVKHKLSSKPFVNDWKNPGYSADAAIKIFDFPKYTSYGVHVLGLDPYREDEVGSSNSLGYITVLRRNHSDLTDDFRGKQVASYLGRTKTVKDFHQMVLDLAEYYNAQILYEHSDRDLLSFFENKHKTHLLMDTVPLQREINVLTKTKNAKGLRPTVTNKKFLINTTLGWVNDELEDDTLGYAKIFDDILLQQLEAYDPDENLDAYIGFSHAVAAYNYFEKFGTPVVTLDTKIEEKKKVHIPLKNAFGITFKRKPTNAFGL